MFRENKIPSRIGEGFGSYENEIGFGGRNGEMKMKLQLKKKTKELEKKA
jgi:hypothetical protein